MWEENLDKENNNEAAKFEEKEDVHDKDNAKWGVWLAKEVIPVELW